jgi:hypothetical protein
MTGTPAPDYAQRLDVAASGSARGWRYRAHPLLRLGRGGAALSRRAGSPARKEAGSGTGFRVMVGRRADRRIRKRLTESVLTVDPASA